MESRQLVPLVLNPSLNVTLIRDPSGLEKLKDFFQRCSNPGWDIETTPTKNYFWRRCRTIQFGNLTEQYVIDLLAFCNGDADLLYKAQGDYGKHLPTELSEVFETICPVLCTSSHLKSGVNLAFEYMNFYWLFGMRTFNFFDCSMVEKCIYAGAHSMKDYGFFSMEEMMGRYFGVQIDKTLQTSFTLEGELSQAQIEYAALDTRLPLAIQQIQNLILTGKTFKELKAKGSGAAKYLAYIDPIVTGDNLVEIAQIENDAIGAFEDMHIHGERLDREKWLARVAGKKEEFKKLITDVLDPIFLPIVGSKTETISDTRIEEAEAKWKSFNVVSDAEIELKARIRSAKKLEPEMVPALESTLSEFVESRKEMKEQFKLICSELKKKRTVIKNLADKCEGNALINYSSDTQLQKVLVGMKGLKKITDLTDDTLEKYEHFPVMAAIRKYHGLAKEIGTYGDQWATEWKTKPCKEEGWLHPGDGRLHCTFNQYDAETGRSSSSQPNAQNLPTDEEIRSCFVADPPDESIRISTCCNADTTIETYEHGQACGCYFVCNSCGKKCTKYETKPEEYVIVTADMSGAELRIIAELANDPIWIGAFSRGEDVHSVGTEILYAEKWPTLQLPECAYFKLKDNGEPQRKKCKCPEHNALRNDNKSTNFLLAYGGGARKLANEIKKTFEAAKDLMSLHEQKFPRIWAYLAESGRTAKMFKKAFDMFGRRRLFPEPTWEKAKEKAKEDREEKLRLPEEEAEKNKDTFLQVQGRKPNKEELWLLTHRQPTSKEIGNAFQAMHGTIERQGKNHSIQGTNATIAKKAMSCGYSPDGKPYLWHTLDQYKAKLIKFVHDELVVQCPKRYGKEVAALIGDAFKRAAAERMKKVVMEFDFNIGNCWKK